MNEFIITYVAAGLLVAFVAVLMLLFTSDGDEYEKPLRRASARVLIFSPVWPIPVALIVWRGLRWVWVEAELGRKQ